MTPYLLIFGAAIAASGFAQAQTATGLEWERAWGGSASDFAPIVRGTADGGWILAGYSYSEPSGAKASPCNGLGDAWIVKVNAAGTLQWEIAYGGTELDRVNDIQQTSDGGFIVGCTSYSPPSGNKSSATFGDADFWILKLNSAGAKQWEQSVGGSGKDELRCIRPAAGGGFVAAGITYSPVSGNKTSGLSGSNASDYWLVKLDQNGGKQWDRTFGGTDADELSALQQTADGGFLLGGHSFSSVSGQKTAAPFGSGTSDFWIVKTDANGNRQWDRTYGGSDAEELNALQTTSEGGYILAGSSSSGVSGNKTAPLYGAYDYWLVKIDAAGTRQWDRSYGGSEADEAHTVQQTADGGYLVGGLSFSSVSGVKTGVASTSAVGDYWMLKTEGRGNKQWEQSVSGSLAGEILTPVATRDNGFVVAGLSGSANLSGSDFGITKVRGPLHFISWSATGPSGFQCQLNGISGSNYVLQASTNLNQWTSVRTNRATNSLVFLSHPNAPGSSRLFFRAQPQL